MKDHVSLLEVGSIPEEGSSSNRILVSPIMAISSWSFLFCPPDSVATLESFFFSRSTIGRYLSEKEAI